MPLTHRCPIVSQLTQSRPSKNQPASSTCVGHVGLYGAPSICRCVARRRPRALPRTNDLTSDALASTPLLRDD
jgi:hypothetical protein